MRKLSMLGMSKWANATLWLLDEISTNYFVQWGKNSSW